MNQLHSVAQKCKHNANILMKIKLYDAMLSISVVGEYYDHKYVSKGVFLNHHYENPKLQKSFFAMSQKFMHKWDVMQISF